MLFGSFILHGDTKVGKGGAADDLSFTDVPGHSRRVKIPYEGRQENEGDIKER